MNDVSPFPNVEDQNAYLIGYSNSESSAVAHATSKLENTIKVSAFHYLSSFWEFMKPSSPHRT